MGTITVNGKEIELGENGYLANLDDWNRDVAGYLRRKKASR
jgi:sulfur relay (sulfurtransferase) DsrC/TusE family protein